MLPKTWKVGSHYAFVKHPSVGVSSLEVSKRLAEELGVVALPSAFFDDKGGKQRILEIRDAGLGSLLRMLMTRN
jgi:aspartate/methionine/tyrosine aminotransferase